MMNRIKKVNTKTFAIMCFITVVFIILPIVLKIQCISDFVAWILEALRYQEYKSAYLGIIGGLLGSWLAVTGAIYTQRKFDGEKEIQRLQNIEREQAENKENIKKIASGMLWGEIRQNDNAIRFNNGEFLKAIHEGKRNYHYLSAEHKISLENWKFVRSLAVKMDIDLAIKIMNLYRYYEFISDFDGIAIEVKEKSQLDFDEYEKDYNVVIQYLEYPWMNKK